VQHDVADCACDCELAVLLILFGCRHGETDLRPVLHRPYVRDYYAESRRANILRFELKLEGSVQQQGVPEALSRLLLGVGATLLLPPAACERHRGESPYQ
jgi:hypothetical protein